MSTLVQDFRHAIRLLVRYPGFSFIAILTLTIGIGVNTTIFSAVWAVVFKPLPYEEPGRLISIWETLERQGMYEVGASPPNFFDWRQQSETFETMAAARSARFTIDSPSGPVQVIGAGVSEGFFEMFGIRPASGRPLDYDQPTALVSEGFRQRYADVSPGETIMLDGRPITITGILPETFHPPAAMSVDDALIWLPIEFIGEDLGNRGAHFLPVAGRLRTGYTIRDAQAELNTLAARLAAEYPENNEGWGVRLVPMHEQTVGPVRTRLVVLFCAVLLILFIACANVSHLVLARSESRRREIAVRKALGGSRLRLIRQIMVENLVLASLGCIGGIGIAAIGARLLAVFGPEEVPRRSEIAMDWTIIGFACGMALLSAVAVAIIPAIRLSGRRTANALRESSPSIARSGRRTTNLIVTIELALALVLVIGAGLLANSLLRLSGVGAGFDTNNLLTLRVFVSEAYDEDEERVAFFDQVREQLSAIPGAESVAATNNLPFHQNSSIVSFSIEGRPDTTESETVSFNQISSRYFETLGIPVVAGREFLESDDASSESVAVISESMRRAYWGDGNPLGQRVSLGSEDAPWMTIVGVVPEVRHRLDQEQGPTLYVPYRQLPRIGMFLILRSHADPLLLVDASRAAVWAVDDDIPIEAVQTMDRLRRESIGERRFYSWLLGSFALIALALAVVGVYGVTSFAVTRRTNEIGIRMALGADRGRVVSMIVRQSIAPLIAGITIGLAGSMALSRFLESLLFEIEPMDPLTISTATGALAAVVVAASLIPALRASRVRPTAALRRE